MSMSEKMNVNNGPTTYYGISVRVNVLTVVPHSYEGQVAKLIWGETRMGRGGGLISTESNARSRGVYVTSVS
jgi:hypothetical protein